MSDLPLRDLYQLASQRFDAGDFNECINWAEQLEDEAKRRNDKGYELRAIHSQATACANIGEQRKGLEAATRLMERAKQYGRTDYLLAGTRLFANRVATLDLRSRWHELKPILLEGLETARRTGYKSEEIEHLRRLGEYAVTVGELEQGYAWVQDALNLLTPDLEFASYCRGVLNTTLSDLMLKWGNYSEAYRYAQISVGAARDYGNPNFVAYAQLALARAEKAQGERAEALGLVEEVLVQARAKKWLDIEGQVEYLRGELMRELGYPEEAEPSARRALVLSQELQLREHEVKSCLSWGQALSALGRRDEARDALQKARRISAERDYEDHFHKAEELLAEL